MGKNKMVELKQRQDYLERVASAVTDCYNGDVGACVLGLTMVENSPYEGLKLENMKTVLSKGLEMVQKGASRMYGQKA